MLSYMTRICSYLNLQGLLNIAHSKTYHIDKCDHRRVPPLRTPFKSQAGVDGGRKLKPIADGMLAYAGWQFAAAQGTAGMT